MDETKFVEMQKSIRDNNEELQDFLLDMENWEKDMKNRDERLRKSGSTNQQKLSKTEQQVCHKAKSQPKTSKVEATQSDMSSSDSETEELMELQRKHLGIQDKEEGNKFFKKGEWNKAIECYTRGLMSDPCNPLLLANRAMALMKIGSFAAAEVDCTQCLSLDGTYVKAYLRRAAARYELQKFDLAKEDVKKVIEIEPANFDAKKLLKSLYQQHGKEFQSDGQLSDKQEEDKQVNKTSKQAPLSKESLKKSVSFIPEIQQTKVLSVVNSKSVISPVQKPPHLRSKVPLKKIIVELEKEDTSLKLDAPWSPCKKCASTTTTAIVKKDTEPIRAAESGSTSIPPCPNSFIEFQKGWEKVTNAAFKYLTQIPADRFPRLFGDLLENDVLSQMLQVLSRGAADEAITVLRALTTVPRFTILKLFLSSEDKKAVERILDSFSSNNELSEQLSNAYLS